MRNIGIFLLFAGLSVSSFAARVEFKGNKRTKTSFLKDQYEWCLDSFGKTEKLIAQCYLNTRLFSEVKVKKTKKKTLITVKERWTLLPIPFARRDSRERRFGAFLFERNFLGRGLIVVGGASAGEFTKQYFMLLKDPYFNRSENPMELRSRYNDAEVIQYKKTAEFNKVDIQGGQHSLMVGKRWNLVEFNIGPFYGNQKWSLNSGSSGIQSLDRSGWGLTTELVANFTKFKFFYNEGALIRLNTVNELSSSGSENLLSRYQLTFSYEYGLSPKLVAQFLGNYITQGSNDPDGVQFLGGARGLRGVQQNGIWATQVATFSLDLTYALSQQSYGTWTLAPFIDHANYQSFEAGNPNLDVTSYGLGAYLFLNKVALPGLGFIYGKNDDFEGNFFTFFLGRQI